MGNTVWNRTSFIGTSFDETIFEGAVEDCYFGTIARNEWLNTPNIRKNVELDVFVIMS